MMATQSDYSVAAGVSWSPGVSTSGSPTSRFRADHTARNVEKRIAFALSFFRMERLTMLMPTSSLRRVRVAPLWREPHAENSTRLKWASGMSGRLKSPGTSKEVLMCIYN